MPLLFARVMILSSILFSLGACSLKKTAENAAKTTEEMNQTTKEMNEQTKALESELTYKESHDQMMKHLNWLFQEGEHINNRGLLQTGYDFLFGLNKDPDLFIAGGGAILSMHFQFWKGFPNEDVAELDKRLELGSETLFDRLFKHVPRDGDLDIMMPDVSFKGVAALGAKLDLIDERYERGLKLRGLPRMTYYDIVVRALRGRYDTEPDPLFPRTMDKIREWVPEAEYLLQLRQNILPVMVIARITDFQDRKDLSRGWMWLWGQDADISKATPAALREWTDWLNKATTTRQDLRSMGIEPRYNSMLAGLVAGVNFGQAEILAAPATNARQQILRDFTEAFQRNVAEIYP